jgi:signal transduction histidine kinase
MASLPRSKTRAHLVTSQMDRSRKPANDVTAQLRHLAHDLSNSIETIMQAGYLLAQTKLDPNGKRWARMIETAVGDAARINRGIREILRNQQERTREKPAPKRRAS